MNSSDMKPLLGVSVIHLLTSLGFAIFTGMAIVSLITPGVEFLVFLFGFYFATVAQTLSILAFSLGVGTLVATRMLSRNMLYLHDRKPIAIRSTLLLAGILSLFFLALFFDDQAPHYGVTAREESYEVAWMSVVLLVEFYCITRFAYSKQK